MLISLRAVRGAAAGAIGAGALAGAMLFGGTPAAQAAPLPAPATSFESVGGAPLTPGFIPDRPGGGGGHGWGGGHGGGWGGGHGGNFGRGGGWGNGGGWDRGWGHRGWNRGW